MNPQYQLSFKDNVFPDEKAEYEKEGRKKWGHYTIKLNDKDIGTIMYTPYTDAWFVVLNVYAGIVYDAERDPRSWKRMELTQTFQGVIEYESIENTVKEYVDFFFSH